MSAIDRAKIRDLITALATAAPALARPFGHEAEAQVVASLLGVLAEALMERRAGDVVAVLERLRDHGAGPITEDEIAAIVGE